MKKNDCILMMGSDTNQPMTLYQVKDIHEDKISARYISITDIMVYGTPVVYEYNNDIPNEAIYMRSDSWQKVKSEMISFVEETRTWLMTEKLNDIKNICIGCHYASTRGVYTVTNIIDNKIRYNMFKLDEDYISPHWTGEAPIDGDKIWHVISEETYKELTFRYKQFLLKIRSMICKMKYWCPLKLIIHKKLYWCPLKLIIHKKLRSVSSLGFRPFSYLCFCDKTSIT